MNSEKIVEYINELRANEGATVVLCCDNPDFNGMPDCIITVCDHWTGWTDKQFGGKNLEQALEKAVTQKRNSS